MVDGKLSFSLFWGGAIWSPTVDNRYSVWNFRGQNTKTFSFIDTKLVAGIVFTFVSYHSMFIIVKD